MYIGVEAFVKHDLCFFSGLLVTISYFRSAAKLAEKPQMSKHDSTSTVLKTNSLKFATLMFYRYIRLTPAYMYVLAVNMIAMRYYHSTSVFNPALIDHITCEKYWWRNALYINNLFPQGDFCMLWSWYMSNDTQFFVIAIILCLIGVR